MALKPLGHRILVKPDTPPEATDSGLVLPQDRHHVPVSGVVMAVGDGPQRDQRIRLAAIARCMALAADCSSPDALAAMRRYRDEIERFDPPLAVGDRVVYPVDAGLEITEDGHTYILLNQDDVAVIATEDIAA